MKKKDGIKINLSDDMIKGITEANHSLQLLKEDWKQLVNVHEAKIAETGLGAAAKACEGLTKDLGKRFWELQGAQREKWKQMYESIYNPPHLKRASVNFDAVLKAHKESVTGLRKMAVDVSLQEEMAGLANGASFNILPESLAESSARWKNLAKKLQGPQLPTGMAKMLEGIHQSHNLFLKSQADKIMKSQMDEIKRLKDSFSKSLIPYDLQKSLDRKPSSLDENFRKSQFSFGPYVPMQPRQDKLPEVRCGECIFTPDILESLQQGQNKQNGSLINLKVEEFNAVKVENNWGINLPNLSKVWKKVEIICGSLRQAWRRVI